MSTNESKKLDDRVRIEFVVGDPDDADMAEVAKLAMGETKRLVGEEFALSMRTLTANERDVIYSISKGACTSGLDVEKFFEYNLARLGLPCSRFSMLVLFIGLPIDDGTCRNGCGDSTVGMSVGMFGASVVSTAQAYYKDIKSANQLIKVATTIHEIGHLMDMASGCDCDDHEKPDDSEGHCKKPGCVMEADSMTHERRLRLRMILHRPFCGKCLKQFKEAVAERSKYNRPPAVEDT